MSFLFSKITSAFLLPPLNLLVLSGLGLLILKRRPFLGRTLLIVSWFLLYTLSTPLIGRMLRQSLETIPPLPPQIDRTSADAIVVLGGVLYPNAPEYGKDTAAGSLLERLRCAARLHRLTGKPILVTGGNPRRVTLTEATIMKEVLVHDFGVPVQWVEDQSKTTWDNAHFSAAILQQHGIHRIYLVTHAMHMPRAQAAFQRAGFHVVPAPTMFATTPQRLTLFHFLPSSSTFFTSSYVLHEWIGQLWYWLRQQLSSPGEGRFAHRPSDSYILAKCGMTSSISRRCEVAHPSLFSD